MGRSLPRVAFPVLDAVSPRCDLGVNCLVELFVSLT
jgi:hypothetical protein